MKVFKRDPYGHCGEYEFKDPRLTTKHGYECPICLTVIGYCQDAADVHNMMLHLNSPDMFGFRLTHDFTDGDYKMTPPILTVEEVVAIELVDEQDAVGFEIT